MKKIFILLVITLIMGLIPACNKTDDTNESNLEDNKEETTKEMTEESNEKVMEETTETETYVLSEYYPFLNNVMYTYRGEGNEYASFNMSVDGYNETRVQTRINNGGTEAVNVIEIDNGQITRIFSKDECYYREIFLSKAPEMTDVLLKEPLVKGTEWAASDGRRRYISGTDVKIVTPAGTFNTVEVITESASDKNMDYYAPGIGLVKTIWESKEGYVVSSTLSQITRNHPLVQRIRFFYPNGNVDGLYYIDRDVTYHTNDITTNVLQNAFKDLPEGNIANVLTENVKINSIYLNKDGILYVDFSKELVSEMNAGAGYESLILASITNTLGCYYSVDRVYITVEGNPYSSGHIEMGRGEAFVVDTEDAISLP